MGERYLNFQTIICFAAGIWKLVYSLFQNGCFYAINVKKYGKITPDELSVQFNDGLPLTENQEVNIAIKKAGGGAIEDVSTILQEHFGKTKEEADAIAETLSQNAANPFASNFLSIPPDEDDGGEPLNGGRESDEE